MKHNGYRHIVAWGRHMESLNYYIRDQVDKAVRDRAPKTAIYYSDREKRWITFEEVTNTFTINSIIELLEFIPE